MSRPSLQVNMMSPQNERLLHYPKDRLKTSLSPKKSTEAKSKLPPKPSTSGIKKRTTFVSDVHDSFSSLSEMDTLCLQKKQHPQRLFLTCTHFSLESLDSVTPVMVGYI